MIGWSPGDSMAGFYHDAVKAPRLLPICAALLLLCAGCDSASTDPAPESAAPARNAASAALLPETTSALPSFDAAAYEELLGQLKGTPAVVNIWASWCGPCRAEAPVLARAARDYGDRVQFLGVDIQDERGSARQFIAQYGWTYPSVFDLTGSIRDHLGFPGQPDTIFYGRDGAIVATHGGEIDAQTLRRNIDELLA
jgi:cytochrome c biogenesis protein CcmG, thiol:disulfide interchange protein DsbE